MQNSFDFGQFVDEPAAAFLPAPERDFSQHQSGTAGFKKGRRAQLEVVATAGQFVDQGGFAAARGSHQQDVVVSQQVGQPGQFFLDQHGPGGTFLSQAAGQSGDLFFFRFVFGGVDGLDGNTREVPTQALPALHKNQIAGLGQQLAAHQ